MAGRDVTGDGIQLPRHSVTVQHGTVVATAVAEGAGDRHDAIRWQVTVTDVADGDTLSRALITGRADEALAYCGSEALFWRHVAMYRADRHEVVTAA